MIRKPRRLQLLFTIYHSLFTFLHVFDDELQTRAAVPAVRLHRVGQFDALAGARRCSLSLGRAPPDALVDSAPGGVDVELQVLLLHDARLADDPQAARDEDGTRPPRAVRLQ